MKPGQKDRIPIEHYIKMVRDAFQKALELLFAHDGYLIYNDISERSISHKLGCYMQQKFKFFDVDCEYNGNVDAENNKKFITILREMLVMLKRTKKTDPDQDLLSRYVYPDIIVHCRGTNEENILIVEVKKTTSKESTEYDFEKLQRYTSEKYSNNLNYMLGVLVIVGNNLNGQPYSLQWFKDGSPFSFDTH